MHRRTALASLPLLAPAFASSVASAQAVAAEPGPPTGPPSPQPAAFEGLPQKIDANYADVQSVVVVRGDRLLFEHYQSGSGVDTLRDVQSVTKSILSLAVGAAIGKGAVRSVEQPVAELLPASAADASPDASALTLRHLLTMTAGFRPQDRFARPTADDPAFLMRRQRAGAPGSGFAYDNLAANLLSVALEGAVGQVSSRFAAANLFVPLGIDAFEWERGANGHSYGYSGLRLRTRDMARLGQLALRAGEWNGVQIVPEAYARAAVAAQNPGGQPVGLAYGYLWWVAPAAPERRTFLASGWGGQVIWVHPPLNLVIAITSAVSLDANTRGQAVALMRNELVRAAAAVPVSTP